MKSSDYDRKCFEEFSILEDRVEPFFVNDKTACPYKLPYTANFHQAMFGPLNDRAMELFLSAGYRRNGNSLYNMHCEECGACVSIRLDSRTFSPNRNQKRVLKRNSDVTANVGKIQVNRERLDLCESFLQTRYPQKKNHASGYYSNFFLNGLTSTFEISYRIDDKLVGLAIIDAGENWMNAVYFFFDVKMGKRSLGIFNILTILDICKKKNINNLYLGYTIKEVSAMNYKEQFFPHTILKDNCWVLREKNHKYK